MNYQNNSYITLNNGTNFKYEQYCTFKYQLVLYNFNSERFYFLFLVHFQRIAHRDIKPANLLLGEGGVQVADLGACGELAGAGKLSGAVGTPAFRAPEAFAPADKYIGEVCIQK